MNASMPLQQPTPVTPPSPPGLLAPAIAGGQGSGQAVAGADPSQVYRGFEHQRDELSNQLRRLQDQRNDVTGQLANDETTPIDRKGLEQRLTGIDQRIAQTEAALAISDANVARAAAIPGAVVDPPPPPPQGGPPDEFWVLSGIFIVVVLMPIAIAFARRIWKRTATVVTQIPQEIYERFARIDQSLDAIAIEVERIGEGQRYLTKVQGERALGAGPAERVELPVREREKTK